MTNDTFSDAQMDIIQRMINKAVAKAVAPLHEKYDKLDEKYNKLNEKYNKLKKDFAELKYSLMYRDMAARVTTTNNIRKKAMSQHSSLPNYLKRIGGKENSKVNRVKQSLHPIAHGGAKNSRGSGTRACRSTSRCMWTENLG